MAGGRQREDRSAPATLVCGKAANPEHVTLRPLYETAGSPALPARATRRQDWPAALIFEPDDIPSSQ